MVNPVITETDDYSYAKYDYLFEDLPAEFQKAVQENRKITSRDLKKILKRAFPSTKFKVRKSSYSGGSSIDIYWTDGPSKDKVERLVKFDTEGFNGMYDIAYTKTHQVLMPDGSVKKLEFDWYGYVSLHREYSKEAIEKAVAELGYENKVEVDKNGYIHTNSWYIHNEILSHLSKKDF